jgi:hypothetical protein
LCHPRGLEVGLGEKVTREFGHPGQRAQGSAWYYMKNITFLKNFNVPLAVAARRAEA